MTTNPHVEEKLNAFTHSVGTGLALAALVVLTGRALDSGSKLLVITALVYGFSQILLYLSSALTHEFYDLPRAHYYLRIFDQISVYLLIAGTYTPLTLVTLSGRSGIVLCALEWGLATLGIFSKLFIFRKKSIVSDLLYIPMGWMLIFVLPAILDLPPGLILSIIIGGITYTGGVAFYLSKNIPYAHVLWHLCVIAGSISFFVGFLRYVY